MKHEMRLKDNPFNKIKNGTKTIELRVYDEKRRKIKKNDLIEFTNRETFEKILTIVEELYLYKTFEELYKHHDKISLGYNEEDEISSSDMDKYYPVDEQEIYGVVGIKVKVLN